MSNAYNSFDVNALILKVREGDQQAFLELLDRYKPLLKSLVSKFESDDLTRSLEEDLLQEATVVFYNAILTYDETQVDVEFGLYARICITNALVSQIRAINKRRVERSVELTSEVGLGEDDSSNPMDEIVKQEALKELYSIIKNNLSDYEYVVWHNYMLGKTAKEIGMLVGNNEKSVTNAIYRIRKKLRQLLDNQG